MSKELLQKLERVIDRTTDEKKLKLYKDGLQKEMTKSMKDADKSLQDEIARLSSKFKIGGGEKKTPAKKPTPKKPTAKKPTEKKPKTKTTAEEKAEKKENVNNSAGKTIEECKEILAKYEAMRLKTNKEQKERITDLKEKDEIIDGTNVKTADATTKTTAEQVTPKIKKEVEQIEKDAEKEAIKKVKPQGKKPKGKTEKDVKQEVEKEKIKIIDQKVEDMTKDLASASANFVKSVQSEIAKFSKDDAKKFLIDLRKQIDTLLRAYGYGGELSAGLQGYEIPWAGGSGRPTPLYAKGGKVSKGDDALRQAEELFNDTRSLERRLREERRLAVETDKPRTNAIDVLKRRIQMNKELAQRMSSWAFSTTDGMNKEKYSKYLNYLSQINPRVKSYAKGGKVLREISTHKAVRNGDMIDIYELDEKVRSIPYENIDDLEPMFDRFEEDNRINMAEFRGMFAKGGKLNNATHKRKQGYNDRMDESLGMRHRGSKKQSLKDRRDEAKGMNKGMGNRAYQSVGTMDFAKGGKFADGGEVEIGDIVNYRGVEYKVTSLGDSGTSSIKELSNIPTASLMETNNPKNKNAKRDVVSTKNKMVTLEELKKQNSDKYAKGGEVGENKLEKTVMHYDGRDWELDKYPSFIDNGDSDEWLGQEQLSLEEAKELAFELGGDEAYDYMDEINEAKDIEELQYALSDLKYFQRDNTYNQSWWGGVIDFGVLTEDGEGYGEALVILRMHRGGDPRGNYYDYAVYKLDNFIEDFPPYFSRLSYYVTDKDGNTATFDTEDMEGYTLMVVEDEIHGKEEGDYVTLDELAEEYNVNPY